MLREEIIKNTAYCGLICPLDSCFANCRGCKEGLGCGDGENCYHKKCCIEKNLNGCWECQNSPCDKGYFSNTNKSQGQFTGCIKYIKEFGLDSYVNMIEQNMAKGLKYGMGGDYGGKTEEEVLDMLKVK